MEIFQEVNDKTSFIKGNLEKFLGLVLNLK